MRATGPNSSRLLRRTLGVLALTFGLLASPGCARRLELSPAEFERIDVREQATEELRVYVSRKLIVVYEELGEGESYEVNKTITEASEERLLKYIIAKNTKGLILEKDERNGAPLLWVAFEASCKDRSCAYGFVQTEDGVFRLTEIPKREGYKQPVAYYKTEKKQLKFGKLKSLAEKNDVFLWKNKKDKIFTVDLVVKKRAKKKRETDVIRGGGVD